jgi:hypothetical protein
MFEVLSRFAASAMDAVRLADVAKSVPTAESQSARGSAAIVWRADHTSVAPERHRDDTGDAGVVRGGAPK